MPAGPIPPKRKKKKVKIKFKLLNESAKLPLFAHKGDAGFDLYSLEDRELRSGERHGFSIGISSEFPAGYFVSIRDRSGLALRQGIHVLGGVVDSGYRGEWKVILINLGSEIYKIKKGERIAQGVVHKLPDVEVVETKELNMTERGEGGFGSTGK